MLTAVSVPATGVIDKSEENVPEKEVKVEAPGAAVSDELAVDAGVPVTVAVRDMTDEALGANVTTPVIEGEEDADGLAVSEIVSSALTDCVVETVLVLDGRTIDFVAVAVDVALAVARLVLVSVPIGDPDGDFIAVDVDETQAVGEDVVDGVCVPDPEDEIEEIAEAVVELVDVTVADVEIDAIFVELKVAVALTDSVNDIVVEAWGVSVAVTFEETVFAPEIEVELELEGDDDGDAVTELQPDGEMDTFEVAERIVLEDEVRVGVRDRRTESVAKLGVDVTVADTDTVPDGGAIVALFITEAVMFIEADAKEDTDFAGDCVPENLAVAVTLADPEGEPDSTLDCDDESV